MHTFLLTGAAGFIAARTAELLVEAGHRVVGIDCLNDAYDVRLKLARLKRLEALSAFKFIKIDIEDVSSVTSLFEAHEFEGVLHLAGRAGVRYSMEHPHSYLRTNAIGTLNVLEAMRDYGVKKLVLSSTSSLYAGQPIPFAESLPVNTPISPYAASKKAAEMLAYTYHHLYGLDISVVRYFTVYGPAGRPDMSPYRFIKWIDEEQPITLYGDGSQSRDFTYVDDIAAGTIAALKPVGFEVINLGGGRRPWSLNEMIALLEELLGKTARIAYSPTNKTDMTETHADINKADRLLGWRPTVDFREGLGETVKWYRNNYEWVRDIRT